MTNANLKELSEEELINRFPQRKNLHPIHTGIATDYLNETGKLAPHLGAESIADLLRRLPIKTYEERYPYELYGQVVNESNRDLIRKLDRLVRYTNKTFVNSSQFDESRLKRIINAFYSLVYGDPQKILFKEVVCDSERTSEEEIK